MRAMAAMNGVAEDATEAEIAREAFDADTTGLYVCPHTAVALVATRKLRAQNVIREHDRVVVVSTASGLKFTELKVGTHDGTSPRAPTCARRTDRPTSPPTSTWSPGTSGVGLR